MQYSYETIRNLYHKSYKVSTFFYQKFLLINLSRLYKLLAFLPAGLRIMHWKLQTFPFSICY